MVGRGSQRDIRIRLIYDCIEWFNTENAAYRSIREMKTKRDEGFWVNGGSWESKGHKN